MQTVMVKFNCDACAREITQEVGAHSNGVPITTGYASEDDGKKICYNCVSARADMIETGRATLYLSYDQPNGGFKTRGWYFVKNGKVGNWPSSLTFAVAGVLVGHHNIAGRVYNFDFTGPDGLQWYGKSYGDNTQIAHCRRYKNQRSR